MSGFRTFTVLPCIWELLHFIFPPQHRINLFCIFLSKSKLFFSDCNGNDLAKSGADYSPRRVSDPGTARARMSNSSVDCIFFQGPNLKNMEGPNQCNVQGPSHFEGLKMSESNQPPLYDVPRLLVNARPRLLS